jgi:hypothetical protein
VPQARRWHVAAGIAYAAGDDTAWCRLPHAALCPARTPDPALTHLTALRRFMAARTRQLIDTGRFDPQPFLQPVAEAQPAPTAHHRPCRPTRPVVQILGIRYLAACPLEDMQCVATSRATRARCTGLVAGPACPPGTWRMLPVTLTNCTNAHRQALPPHTEMAVYDLTALPHQEQLRWRAQHCIRHADVPAGTATTDWKPFDPYAHHAHIHPRLPDTTPGWSGPAGPAQPCAYCRHN